MKYEIDNEKLKENIEKDNELKESRENKIRAFFTIFAYIAIMIFVAMLLTVIIPAKEPLVERISFEDYSLENILKNENIHALSTTPFSKKENDRYKEKISSETINYEGQTLYFYYNAQNQNIIKYPDIIVYINELLQRDPNKFNGFDIYLEKDITIPYFFSEKKHLLNIKHDKVETLKKVIKDENSVFITKEDIHSFDKKTYKGFNIYYQGDTMNKKLSSINLSTLFLSPKDLNVHVDETLYDSSNTVRYPLTIGDSTFSIIHETNPLRINSTPYMNLLNFLIYIIMIAALVGINYKDIWKDILDFKPNWKKKLMWFGIGVGTLFAVAITSNLLQQAYTAIFGIAGSAENQATLEAGILGRLGFLSIISAVLIGPLVEELVFRHAIFAFFKGKLEWIAVAISAIAFGLIHVVSEPTVGLFFYNLTPYLLSGVAFGVCYKLSKKETMALTMSHMVWNLLSVILVLIFSLNF